MNNDFHVSKSKFCLNIFCIMYGCFCLWSCLNWFYKWNHFIYFGLPLFLHKTSIFFFLQIRKNQAIWRGARRLWRIMTGIWRKNQGFGRETKTWDTQKAYNPVECFIFYWSLIIIIRSLNTFSHQTVRI